MSAGTARTLGHCEGEQSLASHAPTPGSPMWTLTSAESFVSSVEDLLASLDMQARIVGSVGNHGYSHKDLDLVIQPLSGEVKSIEHALEAVAVSFLAAYTVDTQRTLNPLPSSDPEEQTFVNLGLKDGRTLELFFPERFYPVDPA